MSYVDSRPLSCALLGLLGLFAVYGCTGQIGAGRAGVNTPQEGVVPGCPPVTRRRARRLSVAEFSRVAGDLLGDDAPTLTFLPDPRSGGFDNNADNLTVSSGLIDDFARAAEQVAAALPVARWAPCTPSAAPSACAASFASAFARRAYGRPLGDDERDRLVVLFSSAADTDGYAAGIRLMAEAMLQSPAFLYRTEGAADDAELAGSGMVRRLSPHELASQLSFLLTGARPDELLLAATDSGRLADPAGLKQEALRLLALPRSTQHLRNFFVAWLGLADLDRLTKTRYFFPDFTPVLRDDMKHEVDLFLEDALAREGGSLQAILGSSSSFVSPLLSSLIYKNDMLEPAAGDERAVRLDPRRRRGVLSLPGFLAAHAAVTRTSPVDRGLFVLRRLFCLDMPDPPADAVIPPLASPNGMRTTRQNQEDHARSPQCAPCHELIDPIGFGFEQMDGIGRFRTDEGGPKVDSLGALVGTDVNGPFTGPAELTDKLLHSRMFKDCFVTHLFRWSEGRDLQPAADACTLRTFQSTWVGSNERLTELLLQLVSSETFSTRRTP